MAGRTHWWIGRWLECRAIYLSIWQSMYQSVYLSLCLSIYLSVFLSICLITFLCVSLSVCLSASLKTKLFCETWLKFGRWELKNETFLQDFLQCGVEVDNIRNEAILQDFLQKWKVECWADSVVPMRFTIFSPDLSKVLHPPRKSEASS